MTDDIVARLRDIAPIHEGRKRHECIAEAADEIERLRAERDRWKLACGTVKILGLLEPVPDELHEKAVRHD